MESKNICLCATGSSFICLDGVPFKISETCVQPNKVTLPLQLDTGNPSDILFMEYDLTLESTVIQWGNSQKFAKKTRKSQQKTGDAEINTNEEVEQAALCPKPPTEDTTVSNSSVVPIPVVPANVYVSPSDILVPTQISAVATANDSNNALASDCNIDLKDFEREEDPFENLSLCVMNDREELDKVFFAVT